MGGTFQRVAVVGSGGVGSVVAHMLTADGFEVTAADASSRSEAVTRCDVTDSDALDALLGGVDAVVSALPGDLNAEVARSAHRVGVHYLDPSENRVTSAVVQELSASAEAAMTPHCGLAPGLKPRTIAGRRCTAIAWTTAAGIVSIVQLLAAGALPQRRLVRQEDVPLDAFLATAAGSLLAAA